jgi:hypothetical protein
MAINLMGFVSGFAKGATQRITEEREKEETALANRFKLAAVNKMTREKEANELKGLYAERIKNFNAAYPEAAEEEVLAAVSTESNYKNLMAAYDTGEKVNLKSYLTVNKDSIPKDFTTAREYIDKMITPQVTGGGEAAQTRSVFGARVTPSDETRRLTASQFGISADELDAYSQGSVAVPDLPAMGSLSSDLMKAPETVAQRVAKARSSLQQAELSGDTTAKEEAQKIISAGIAAESFGKPYNLKEEVDTMKSEALKLKDSADPAEVAKRKAIESQIMYLENLGKKETTGEISTQVNSLAGRLRRTVSNVAADMMPAGTFTMVGDQLIPTALVEGDISIKAKKAGFSQALAVLATEGLVNSAGKLLSPTAKSAWLAAGGKIGEGDIALVPDIGNTGTATGSSTGGKPPPPASRTGQSTPPLMSAEDIIKERKLADAAVEKNVDRATVAAAFKMKTGVDY